MTTSWLYDGFPLKRADENTQGDDYQYVIQSLDAAIRHTFGLPTGEEMTPAFSITAEGAVEVLVSLAIGTDVTIDEIVDTIPTAATSEDDEQLATVGAIRTFLGDYVDSYLASTDLFVEKDGDTMTGQLIANGGISATTALNLENVVFTSAPKLGTDLALQSSTGADLIKFSGGALVGDSEKSLLFTGSGTRPTYKGSNIALVEDLVDATGLVLAYVPQIGGTFTGSVEFANGLSLSSGLGITMEYNSGASSFILAQVGTDAIGDVEFDSAGDIFRFKGDVRVDEALQLYDGASWVDAVTYNSGIEVGEATEALKLVGSEGRPTYNGTDLALSTDISSLFQAGAGITFSALGASATEIGITTNGINATMMPVGNNGEYLRLSPVGLLIWDSLDITAGTGMAVSEDAGTKQITVSIDSLGVDTAQIAADAVTIAKMADDSVAEDQIAATDPTAGFVAGQLYGLFYDYGTGLVWQRGGELLGTAELVGPSYSGSPGYFAATYVTQGTEGSPDKEYTASSGPYVITEAVWLGDKPGNDASVYLLIQADGVEVYKNDKGGDGGAKDYGSTDEEPYLRGAIIAKESISIKLWATGTAAEGGYVRIAVQRMN
jgi:hypothetical protein